jgi:hypothetical protein
MRPEWVSLLPPEPSPGGGDPFAARALARGLRPLCAAPLGPTPWPHSSCRLRKMPRGGVRPSPPELGNMVPRGGPTLPLGIAERRHRNPPSLAKERNPAYSSRLCITESKIAYPVPLVETLFEQMTQDHQATPATGGGAICAPTPV